MSVKYIPVQWNPNKWVYDAVLIAAAAAYLWIFIEIAPGLLNHERPIDPQIRNMRAFGSCAFLMLTVILCLGPLARLDTRFLPLMYNRRHFGVLTTLVALTHFSFVLDWYYAFSRLPGTRTQLLLSTSTGYDRAVGFPFEVFGIFALIALLILAATSHDFWLKFLTPRLWKRLHLLIYPAYAAVLAHMALGSLQDQANFGLALITLAAACVVGGLHIAVYVKENPVPKAAATDWVPLCSPDEIRDGFARIVCLTNGERVAVFRDADSLSAISNACAHQNGPLGEGRIIDGCVTCPWHGFQYRVTDGRSPEPFTEKVPTYNLRLQNGVIEVDPKANPPGTPVDPLPIGGAS